MNHKAAIEELDAMLDFIRVAAIQAEEGGPPLIDPDRLIFKVMGDVSSLAIILKELVRDVYDDEE